MKKIMYIIPGWQEFSRYKVYQSLAMSAREKGYDVIFFDVDWKKTLSSQIFPVKKDAVIFGFSLGAVMARLISQDYECAKIVLASMTPLHSFKDRKMKSQLVDLLGENSVDDISKKLRPEHRARKQLVLYGDREGTPGDIIVPKTGHRLNVRYNKEIINLL